MEEFQEAEILWPEHTCDECPPLAEQSERGSAPALGYCQKMASSCPIRIPSPTRSLIRSGDQLWFVDGGDGFGDGESGVDGGGVGGRRRRTPPHAIVARRWDCSSCSRGKGTLRGRELARVRNRVLRITGFYELDEAAESENEIVHKFGEMSKPPD